MKPLMYVLNLLLALPLLTFSQATVATELTHNIAGSPVVNVHSKCLEHFTHSFKNITNALWSVTDEGYGVHFTDKDIIYDVRYNHKGRWLSTIRYIPVQQLSENVARNVLREYRHYSIFFAQQVSVPMGSVYFVKIKKGNKWKFLRVINRQVEIIGEYVNG